MKQYTHKKRWLSLALAMLLLLLPSVALAAVELTANANSTSVQAGDTVEVTITVAGTGMAIAEGVFTYDPAVLSYTESEGGASDGFLNMVSSQKGGSGSLTARIRFTAVGAGNTEVKATIEKVLGYDGKEQAGATASVSISVAAPAPTPTPAPLDYAAKGVLAQNVTGASENMYIWHTLENVTVPSRYSEFTLTYHGESVAAAKVEDSDAPTLLYLSNATGDVGGYYIYNETADTLYPYQTVSSVSKSYILLAPDGIVPPPDGFTQTTLTIGEKQYTAWKTEDAQGEIYLLYARNPDGEVGYYVYNAEDESLQRYAVMPARPIEPTLPPEVAPTSMPVQPEITPTAERAGNSITLSGTMVIVLSIVGALLLAGIAWLVVTRSLDNARRKRRAAQRKAEREREFHQDVGQ